MSEGLPLKTLSFINQTFAHLKADCSHVVSFYSLYFSHETIGSGNTYRQPVRQLYYRPLEVEIFKEKYAMAGGQVSGYPSRLQEQLGIPAFLILMPYKHP